MANDQDVLPVAQNLAFVEFWHRNGDGFDTRDLKSMCPMEIKPKPINKKRPNPIDAHVGSRVRLRRMMLNMSQEKLGEQLGITFQQVQKYEKGTNRIGASRLHAIANILQVQVAFFFEDAPDVSPIATAGFVESGATSHVMEFLSTNEGLQLNRAFVQIKDPKLRKSVVDLVRSMTGEIDD